MSHKIWQPGDRVRIKKDAFGNSQEECDVRARGAVGTLLGLQAPGLWVWRGDDGVETAPITSELEELGEKNDEIDITEAMRLTGKSRETLMRWKRTGKLTGRIVEQQYTQRQRRVLFRRDEIERLIGEA